MPTPPTTASARARATQLLAQSPLRHRSFRQFYTGSVGTALGYTMQASMAAWLMATLTPSALMVFANVSAWFARRRERRMARRSARQPQEALAPEARYDEADEPTHAIAAE